MVQAKRKPQSKPAPAVTAKPWASLVIDLMRRAPERSRLLDTLLFGDDPETLRREVASALAGQPLAKDDVRCSFPLLRKALLAHVGAAGDTVAEQDLAFAKLTTPPELPPRLFLYDKDNKLVGSVPLNDGSRKSFKTDFEMKLLRTDDEGSEHYQFVRILKFPRT